jgi:ABC-type lipoprotein export system ATPase subunit
MLLEMIEVSKGYGKAGTPSFRPVLRGISWKLEEGEQVGIIGPSGSGKTTLLNIAGGLDLPDSGMVRFKNRVLGLFSAVEMAHFRNRELGFVFQQHHLLPQCTLFENVLLPVLPLKKRISDGDRIWAEHLLKKTGIWNVRNQKPGEMSGGECQRAAVVRALVNKPSMILADEPTGALDESNADMIGDLLVTICKEEKITLVTVTHSANLAAKMNHVFHLRNGILIS